MAELPDQTFEEMARAFEARYDILGVLGEGAFGKVYKASAKTIGKVVAIKKMKFGNDGEGVPQTALREVALLKGLSHENVLKLVDTFCSPSKLILVFEFLDLDLKKFMKGRGRHLDPTTVKWFTFQLCQGVEYLHANRIIHRDLKPANLLIDSSLRLKIGDLGLARTFSVPVPTYTHEVVTLWYRPLEILLGSRHYSVPVDAWGTGCIMAEMATGYPLFWGDCEIDTIFKIFQKLGTPTVEQWPELADLPAFRPSFPKWKHRGWEHIRDTEAQVGSVGIDLLSSLLTYDPKQRMSARRALQHPYFADVEVPQSEG